MDDNSRTEITFWKFIVFKLAPICPLGGRTDQGGGKRMVLLLSAFAPICPLGGHTDQGGGKRMVLLLSVFAPICPPGSIKRLWRAVTLCVPEKE
jgi:hypothetical protein